MTEVKLTVHDQIGMRELTKIEVTISNPDSHGKIVTISTDQNNDLEMTASTAKEIASFITDNTIG